MEPGDKAIHLFLKERLPEGKILSEEEMKSVKYWLVLSEIEVEKWEEEKLKLKGFLFPESDFISNLLTEFMRNASPGWMKKSPSKSLSRKRLKILMRNFIISFVKNEQKVYREWKDFKWKNQVNDLKTIKPTTLSVPFSTKNSFDLALKCIVKMGMKVYYYQVIKIF